MKILWIPHTGWHITQRAHLFCRELARQHEVHVTDWIADFRMLRDYTSLRYLRNFTYRRTRDGEITVHGIPRVSPAIFSPQLRKLNTVILQRFVERIIDRYEIAVVVGTYLVPPPAGVRVVFDLFDENVYGWRASGHERLADEIAEIEAAYFQRADAVVAASSVLRDKALAQHTAAPITVIPNGVRLADFTAGIGSALRSSYPGNSTIVGSIANYGSRAEIDLLLDAAKLLQADSVLLYLGGTGAPLAYGQQRAEAEHITNVNFIGAVRYERLPAVLDSFDVGLCLYPGTPMDDARSPMRLIAYSALGLPTVATATEEIKRMNLPNVVLVKATAASVAAGVRQAITKQRERPAAMARYDVSSLARAYESVLMGTS